MTNISTENALSAQAKQKVFTTFWPVVVIALAIFVAFDVRAEAVEGDGERGRGLASVCMGCHGVGGLQNVYPTYAVPKLGGQNARYIIDALRAYRSNTRKHFTMQGNAANLSDQDIKDIATYFSQLSSQ